MKETQPAKRRTRKPVGAQNKLELINAEPGREYRLINDTPMRRLQFERAGWRFEKTEDYVVGAAPGKDGTVEGTFHAGGGQKQVLVSIEKEFYDEDQALKEQRNAAQEAGIMNKTADGLKDFYGEVKITRS